MSDPKDHTKLPIIQFYVTAPYGCSYLPGMVARSQVVTPPHLIDSRIYSDLVQAGFRRSGLHTYRPHCDNCQECKPARIDVQRFQPNRAQRRSLKHHANLVISERSLHFREEHYQLYQRYQNSRHEGGGMDQDSREQYTNFLLESNIDSRLIEFRENGELRMISIVDVLTDGLSSVYTFYDTSENGASYGTYGILWQIEEARRLGKRYVYLGYWIRDSRKMAYKANFAALEILENDEWQAPQL